MTVRIAITIISAVCCIANVGCYGCLYPCGGYAGSVYDCGCATCGCPEAACGCPAPACGCADDCCPSCGCAEAECGCPIEAGCGCPTGCGGGVCCGSAVVGPCPLLRCLRNALWGCLGCGCGTYWSEWHCDPPCACDPCDSYGNYTGGHYGGMYGRRSDATERYQEDFGPQMQMARQPGPHVYR